MEDNRIVKVCFVAPKAYPLFNPSIENVFGGAELDFYLLSKEIAKDKNFQVSFITADYGQKQIEEIDGVRIIKTLDFSQNSLTGAFKIWKGLHKADAQIYLQKTASLGTFLIALFCRLHKKSFVYRTASQKECDGTYQKEHFFSGLFFKWALRNARFIIAQNKNDRLNLKERIGLESVVIPNGHHIPEFVPEPERRDTILWVGRSAQEKRPEIFIQLAMKIPEEHFTMICQRATGDDSYSLLKENADKVTNIRFIERVPFEQVDDYFKRAKIFVNTSDTEGFPNTFIQACSYAAPIVSLRVNPDSFLTAHSCGIYCCGDKEKLVSAIKELLNEDEFVRIGNNAMEYVKKNHDIKNIVDKYKELFFYL